jgi:4-hydroxy-3-methylbut-2-en-1-yl diphosphate reductase
MRERNYWLERMTDPMHTGAAYTRLANKENLNACINHRAYSPAYKSPKTGRSNSPAYLASVCQSQIERHLVSCRPYPVSCNRNERTQEQSLGNKKKIVLASPRGFCAGVVRAIDTVDLALEVYGQPIYVRREIVHNKFVVNELHEKGIIFVNEVDEVPASGRVIFSAHGVSPEVSAAAITRKLEVIDATCPLVTKVHREAIKYARLGYAIILIGHSEHDEVIGTLGEAPDFITVLDPKDDIDGLQIQDPEKVVYLTQTTLSLDDTRRIVDKLRQRFPRIKAPGSEGICYATQNRQSAVLELARKEGAELILVVGSANSSNSRRLVEVAHSAGTPAHLIDDIQDIQKSWLKGVKVIGLTAGASAPEGLVERVLHYLNILGYPDVETAGDIVENVEFSLPPELSKVARNSRLHKGKSKRNVR